MVSKDDRCHLHQDCNFWICSSVSCVVVAAQQTLPCHLIFLKSALHCTFEHIYTFEEEENHCTFTHSKHWPTTWYFSNLYCIVPLTIFHCTFIQSKHWAPLDISQIYSALYSSDFGCYTPKLHINHCISGHVNMCFIHTMHFWL